MNRDNEKLDRLIAVLREAHRLNAECGGESWERELLAHVRRQQAAQTAGGENRLIGMFMRLSFAALLLAFGIQTYRQISTSAPQAAVSLAQLDPLDFSGDFE